MNRGRPQNSMLNLNERLPERRKDSQAFLASRLQETNNHKERLRSRLILSSHSFNKVLPTTIKTTRANLKPSQRTMALDKVSGLLITNKILANPSRVWLRLERATMVGKRTRCASRRSHRVMTETTQDLMIRMLHYKVLGHISTAIQMIATRKDLVRRTITRLNSDLICHD